MVFSLTWLADVLRAAGLKVAEQPGWQSRGRGPMGSVRGVICHHTAGPKSGIMPSLKVVTDGRPGLDGPLAQLGLGRDGTWFVIAAGRANHAGAGAWKGITAGNTSFIGIEAENQGIPADPWPAVQVDAYKRGVAAILKKLGADVSMCIGHKEWAPRRKIDPSFDMDDFRAAVTAIMAGSGPAPPLIPPKDDDDRPTLRRGAVGEAVKIVQAAVRVAVDGIFGAATEAAVRQFQRDHGLVPDGIVGPLCWAAIIAAGAGAPPQAPAGEAKSRPTLRRGDRGEAVKIVQAKVGVHDDGIFGPATEAAVREFQRSHGLAPDGIVGPRSWAAIDGD
jgi:peptidoglycan hydrolase-like protein with peptidoglycan-binding domain